jgi:hypothetical protein
MARPAPGTSAQGASLEREDAPGKEVVNEAGQGAASFLAVAGGELPV